MKSLFENFPNCSQKNIKIATFGKNTFQAGLKIDIEVPTPQFISMAMALEEYIT
nr:hypothetical protein [Blattabacterium cuenoti]